MTFQKESARGEPCGPSEPESHGEVYPTPDEWDGFRLLLVDQGLPDEFLFAREVLVHAHAKRENTESFPDDQVFM